MSLEKINITNNNNTKISGVFKDCIGGGFSFGKYNEENKLLRYRKLKIDKIKKKINGKIN